MTRSLFVTRIALAERQALCDTLLAVGPDAPTLCEGWDTRDLLAHLIIRENRPDLSVGLLVKPLAGRLDAAQRRLAGEHFGRNVERLRSGPPAWAATRLAAVDEATNRIEMFVHHEDVLRAQPDAAPRELDDATAKGLWASLSRMAGMLMRRSPVGIVLVADGVGRAVVKAPQPAGNVVVRGQVADLVLYCYGRKGAAHVELKGSDEAVAALAATRFGV